MKLKVINIIVSSLLFSIPINQSQKMLIPER